MSGLREWFRGRSVREQRLLLAMLALAAVTLIWGGIVRPVGDALSSERARHADAVERLGETRNRIDALHDAERDRPQPITGTLSDVMRASADRAGFTLSSVVADGSARVRIAIPSARAAALTDWLARLERAGVLVDQATMTDNGDRTVAATLVLEERQQ